MTQTKGNHLWEFNEIENFYSKFADEYDKDIEQSVNNYPAPHIIGNWMMSQLKKRLDEGLLAKGTELRVLDLGCGTGQSSKVFFEHHLFLEKSLALNITGIDGTSEMLEKARKLPFTNLKQQNIESFPLPSPYDAVICIGVIDFIREPLLLFQEVKRIINTNGLFGFTAPNSGDLNRFSKSELVDLAIQAQFKVLEYDLFHGYNDSSSNEAVKYHGMLLQAV